MTDSLTVCVITQKYSRRAVLFFLTHIKTADEATDTWVWNDWRLRRCFGHASITWPSGSPAPFPHLALVTKVLDYTKIKQDSSSIRDVSLYVTDGIWQEASKWLVKNVVIHVKWNLSLTAWRKLAFKKYIVNTILAIFVGHACENVQQKMVKIGIIAR